MSVADETPDVVEETIEEVTDAVPVDAASSPGTRSVALSSAQTKALAHQIRNNAANRMLKWSGKPERPANSNHFPPLQIAIDRLVRQGVDVPAEQRHGGYPYCIMAAFVCYAAAGSSSAIRQIEHSNAAYTVQVLEDAREKRNGLSITTRPVRGDIVLFDFPDGAEVDHAGIVLDISDRLIITVECNTSPGRGVTTQGCWRRTRPRGVAKAFVRLKA